MKRLIHLFLLSLCCISARAERLPADCFENVADYGFMWWRNGLQQEKVFCILTSRYGLEFDSGNATLDRLLPVTNGYSEAQALALVSSSVPGPSEVVALACVVEVGAARYQVSQGNADYSKCHLVENGKYVQRRFLTEMTYEAGAPGHDTAQTGLEVVSWPDRVSFIHRFNPTTEVVNGALEVSLDLSAAYSNVLSSGSGRAFSDASGRGYVLLPTPAGATILMDSTNQICTVRYAPGAWSAGTTEEVGLTVYPAAEACAALLAKAVESETSPLQIGAQQIEPTSASVNVTYEPERGWYKVAMPQGGAWHRIAMSVTNNTANDQAMRINFARDGSVYKITGINPLIRDTERNPAGIPIQVSKNWHVGSGDRFEGPWFHAFTMITIPANTNVNFEYTRCSGLWGGLPAVNHAQLALMGWGGNQQWDQAAMGCWGESITFDPDVGLGRSMIDDVRPLMVWGRSDTVTNMQWNWTDNVGGGDFLAYYNGANQKQWNGRVRTQYKRMGPNITEVTYAGQSQDKKIELQCTARLVRSDDLVRILYRLRYDVAAPVDFERLAFFQLGADNYNNHLFGKMARGNATDLLEEWVPAMGGNAYSRQGIACVGTNPWFSLHEGERNNTTKTYGAWANRAMIIRAWDATLGGAKAPTPFASVYGTENNGYSSANVELSVPPGITRLLPGDYVDVEIEQLTIPQFAADYYGPNTNLYEALLAYENTWQMVHREAAKHDLEIDVQVGAVEQVYPTRITTAGGCAANFTIRGGVGYTPVTFRGVSDYRDPMLYEDVGGTWEQLDQSVNGKDYWQADYNAASTNWDVTYNIGLDTSNDVQTVREFLFVGGVADRQTPMIENLPAAAVSSTSAVFRGLLVSTGDAPSSVWVAWGAEDAGPSTSGWDNVVSFSEIPDLIPQHYSTNIATLSSNMTYFYRFGASNEWGQTWAWDAGSLVTHGPPVLGVNGCTNAVRWHSATIQGVLLGGGGADVGVCWGTNALALDNISELLTVDTGELFDIYIGGLAGGMQYFYRIQASNEYGSAQLPISSFTVTDADRPVTSTPLPMLWLQADSIGGKTNGESVDVWTDDSGHGFNMVQTNASAMPAFAADVINGLPAVRFAPGRSSGDIAADIGAAKTVFIVYRQADSQSQWTLVFGGSGSGLHTTGPNGTWCLEKEGGGIGIRPTTSSQSFSINEYALESLNQQLWINSASAGTAAINTSLSGTIRLGAGFQGEVIEVLMYDTDLSEFDRSNIGAYLASKYGIHCPDYVDLGSLPAPLQVPGCRLWLDASDIDGDGEQEGLSESGLTATRVDAWADKSGSINNSVLQAGTPALATNAHNGMPVVNFASTFGFDDSFALPSISDIRTVFWVVNPTPGQSSTCFLLGGNSTYNFHRGPGGAFWDATYAHTDVLNGATRTNGVVVSSPTTTGLPDGFSVISLVTAGNVQCDQLTRDRAGQYRPSWNGDIAELIIYDSALGASDRQMIEQYLFDKWVNPDLDSDGIEDAWELQHFGNLDTASQIGSDWDDDGFPDSSEYIAGTSPTNASSLLALSELSFAGTNLVVVWPSESNRLYRVGRIDDLLGSWTNISALVPSTPPLNTYTDNWPELSGSLFYRVTVEP